MRPDEFSFLSELLKKRSGLHLTPDKEYLLESRLKPVARTHGQEDVSGLIQLLKAQPSNQALLKDLTESMTTNESMFFRDNKPFLRLKEALLPRMQPHYKSSKLRIWSAACSNGQEPYSLAMTMEENKLLQGALGYEIVATDLDTQVLAKAQEGIYTQFEVQRGLSIQMLIKFFGQVEGGNWQIKPELKRNVRFKQQNLLEPFSAHGTFDIIMCRNVLIYFDEATKRDILERLAKCLHPHGLLFLGSAETAMGLTTKLKALSGESGVFVRDDSTF